MLYPVLTSNIFFSISTFILGIVIGYFGRGLLDEKTKNNSNIESRFVLVMVVTVWAISVLVDISSPQYETSPLLHGIMGAIVGFFFKPWEKKQ